MGSPSDPHAVLDPQMRVIGVEGLRVVDSSTMPSITNANLNAPTIMMAEKAADHILGKPLLAPSNAPYYAAPDWQLTQR
jgi:choline dehydrogenase